MAPRDGLTLELFDWTPPTIVERFAAAQIKAPTFRDRMARAVATVLTDSSIPRKDIARQMGEVLGEDMSLNMLNNYASQAHPEHVISAVRLAALSKVTGDYRALQLLADEIGYALVPVKYVAAIEDAMLTDQIDAMKRSRDAKRRGWKA